MKKRIAFFQNELTVGGIQKSLINLLSNFDYDKYDVDLYLFSEENYWKSELPQQLNIKYMKPVSKLLSFVPFKLAKALIKPNFGDCGVYDLAIDFNSYQNSCAVGAIKIPAKKRVMWIHNDVEIKLNNEWKYKFLWTMFKGKFKYYDEFIAVSEGIKEPFKKMSRVSQKVSSIQNYISIKEIEEKMQVTPENFSVDSDKFNFVALGRLCHQKGYDIMLDNFATALKSRDDLRLYIIGDGEDRQLVENRIKELSLEDKVFLLGNQANPFCYMKLMDAFISTSRYEGQPLNIMEAKAVGLPTYCTKNLEKYAPDIEGYEDIVAAMISAEKTDKKPDKLIEYNTTILNSIYALAE
ncbi:MAG: glycosyltransferase [Clostridia bacterium]|nr:glycosyltransferase [Clostridia bacterium]